MGVLRHTDGQKWGYLDKQMDRNRGTWVNRWTETGVLGHTDGQKQGYFGIQTDRNRGTWTTTKVLRK